MSQPLAETAIEVRADTEPFEDDLERTARRTRRRKITQPVEAEVDVDGMLRQIEDALGDLRGDVDVDPDTRRLIRELDDALDGYTGDVSLDPNIRRLVQQVDGALAGLKIGVPIEPRVDGAPLRDARGRFIKAGAEVGDEAAEAFDRAFGRRVLDAVKKVGRSVGKVAAPIALVFGGGAVGAIALANSLTLLSATAAGLGPAFAAGLAFLPGFLAARAVAVGAFQLAVVGLGDALTAAAEGDAAAFEESLEKLSPAAREFATAARDAVDALRPLQQQLQDATFANLADEVAEVGRDLQSINPQLTALGQGFNALLREALSFAGSDVAIGALMDTLTGLRAVIDGIVPAVGPLAAAFAGLAGEAGAFGPALGQALGDLGLRFADFLDRVDLQQLFAAALPVAQQFGQLLSNIGAILSGIFAAAPAGAGGLLSILVELTGVVAEFIESAGGFATFSALLQAAADVAGALGTALGAVLPALGAAIVPVAQALAPLADTIAAVLAAVTPLLGPIGQLVALLGGALVQAVTPLIPVVQQLAQLLGGLLASQAPLLAQLGQTIAGILAPAAALLAELFEQLGPVIAELAAAVGSALAPLLTALAPLFVQLVDALMPLIPAIVQLLPPIVQIVVALTPLIELIAQLLTVVVAIAAPILELAANLTALLAAEAIAPLLNLIARALTAILSPLSSVTGWLAQFAGWINSIDWSGVASAIGGAFVAAWQAVVTYVGQIVAFVQGLPGRLMAVLASIPGLVVGLFTRMGQLALQAVGAAIGLILFNFLVLPGKIAAAIASIPGLLRGLFARAGAAARAVVSAAIAGIVGFFAAAPGRISGALVRVISVVSSIFSRALSSGRAAVSRGIQSIVSIVASAPGRLAALAGRFAAAGGRLIRSLVDGLKRVPSLGSIASSIAGALRSALNSVAGAINSGIAAVDRVLPGSLPRLPRFARGAVVDEPTLGVFGEAGREVIIPLEKPARARQLAVESGLDRILSGGSNGSPIYVSLRAYIGATEITSMIRFEVDRSLDETAAQVDAGPRGF